MSSAVVSLIKLGIATGFVGGLLTVAFIAFGSNEVTFRKFPLEPVSYKRPAGVLSKKNWNTVISDDATRIAVGNAVGPESLAYRDGLIYTGLADGRVVSIDPDTEEVKLIAWLSRPQVQCQTNNYWQAEKCGRALGCAFGPDGNLLIMDTTQGLFSINVTTGDKTIIALDEGEVGEYKGLYNSFAVDIEQPHIVYATVTTRRWGISKIVWSVLEHEDTGLIVAVNTQTRKIQPIVRGATFPNGIEFSADNKYLLYAETVNDRVLKVELAKIRQLTEQLAAGQDPPAGAATLTPDVFVDNLPGMPDNMRLHAGDLWVGVPIIRVGGLGVLDYLSDAPLVRRFVARSFYTASVCANYFRRYVYNSPLLEFFNFQVESGHLIYEAVPKTSGIVRVDGTTGKVKQIYGANFPFVTEGVFDPKTGHMYVGSFRNNFLLKVNMKDFLN